MNISWFEVFLDFTAISLWGLQGIGMSLGINHGATTGMLSLGAFLYGTNKAAYAFSQWWNGKDREEVKREQNKTENKET